MRTRRNTYGTPPSPLEDRQPETPSSPLEDKKSGKLDQTKTLVAQNVIFVFTLNNSLVLLLNKKDNQPGASTIQEITAKVVHLSDGRGDHVQCPCCLGKGVLSKEANDRFKTIQERDVVLDAFGEDNFAELSAILLDQIQRGEELDSPEDMWKANEMWQYYASQQHFSIIYYLILTEYEEEDETIYFPQGDDDGDVAVEIVHQFMTNMNL